MKICFICLIRNFIKIIFDCDIIKGYADKLYFFQKIQHIATKCQHIVQNRKAVMDILSEILNYLPEIEQYANLVIKYIGQLQQL